MKIAITPETERTLTFQDYSPQPDIRDACYKPLKKFRGLEGAFMECLRLTDGAVESISAKFELRQLSISFAVPGRINAFHIHTKEIQDELWCVTQGTLMVWLVDIRQDSPTKGNKRRYVLGGDEPGLLYIPSGVAHGYKAGAEGATLLYAMNSQFNIKDPNEGRLPHDYFGSKLWEEDRG